MEEILEIKCETPKIFNGFQSQEEFFVQEEFFELKDSDE